jgi:hypothetical protein
MMGHFKIFAMQDERIRELEREARSGDPTARILLARELARAGRREDARVALASLLRSDPTSAEGVRALDDLGFGPLAADAPWPTTDGGNDRARRSAHPGPRKGELVKRIRIGREGETALSLTVGPKTAYLATRFDRLVALDLENGSPRWIKELDFHFDAPAIGEGERLLLGEGGKIQLLEPERGDVVWSVRPPGRVETRDVPVAFAPRGLVVAAWEEGLHAFELWSGKLVWSFKANGELHTRPTVTPEAIFVSTSRGYVHAVHFDGKPASEGRTPRTKNGRRVRIVGRELYLEDIWLSGERVLKPLHVMGRDGAKLDATSRVAPVQGGGFACALDDERALFYEDPARIVTCGADTALTRERLRGGCADSTGCVYGFDPNRGFLWLDPTVTLVKKLLDNPSGPREGPWDQVIGPDSTLLVATEQGILLVIS